MSLISKNNSYPPSQRGNLLDELANEISEIVDSEDKTYPNAFRDVALNWLGLLGGTNIQDDGSSFEGYRSDGTGDRGIDFYVPGETSFEVVQSKAFDKSVKETKDELVSIEGIKDLSRIVSYIQSVDEKKNKQNRAIQRFQRTLSRALRSLKNNEKEPIFEINITLLIAGKGLSSQANEESQELASNNGAQKVEGVDCIFNFEVVTIDTLLAHRWHVTNSDWRDDTGKKSDRFSCQIMGNVIKDKKVKVFYAKAIDLIDAYSKFGQRIFETNVRCQISNSNVNKKIAEQISTEKGIKEFYLLNNGVTIVANSVSTQGTKGTFVKPGIVNGLQTVTTLSDAYSKLEKPLKKVFNHDCWVLVRAYETSDVPDVNKLVVATNNQNKMDPRNLKSNEGVQIKLEQVFAEHNWFYERKQFAWNAFKAEPASWPTLQNKRPTDFLITKSKYKRADNILVSQAWLSFSGFTNEAMHEKARIFEEGNSIYYPLIFERRAKLHAHSFGYERSSTALDEYFEDQAPPASGLLFAFLLHQCAKTLTPSNQVHRQNMEKTHGFPDGMSKEERDRELLQDPKYLVGLIKNTSSFIYVELVSYILFKIFGDKIYSKFDELLLKTDVCEVYQNANYEKIERELSQKKFGANSFIGMTWSMFSDLIEGLIQNGSWYNNYLQASSRPRLIYNKDTRNLIFENLERWIEFADNGRALDKDWSEYIDKNKKGFLKGILSID